MGGFLGFRFPGNGVGQSKHNPQVLQTAIRLQQLRSVSGYENDLSGMKVGEGSLVHSNRRLWPFLIAWGQNNRD